MKLSIIIPVFHEDDVVWSSLTDLLRHSAQFDHEIIISDVDDDPSTSRSLQQCLADHPDINGRSVTFTRAAAGRFSQMNAAADRAAGDVLLFLHADTRLPEGFSEEIAVARQNKCRWGAFTLSFDRTNSWLKLVARVANLRTRLTGRPLGDQAIWVEAGLFKELGGYAAMPFLEDIELCRRLKKYGRGYLSRRPVQTSSRRWYSEGMVYTTLRNWTVMVLYRLGVSADSMAGWYRPARPGLSSQQAGQAGRPSQPHKEGRAAQQQPPPS